MYEKFYNLTAKPFQMVPNPAFLYFSDLHRNAMAYLEYGLMERVGFILLTGEIGTGKTTLIRSLLDKLPANTVPALLFNTNVDGEQLIRLILHEFEVVPVESKAGNIDLLQQYLIGRFAAGKNPVLIIDEAQNLTDEALEEVRMLFNLQTDDEMLLQIILVGQPELQKRLNSPHLCQLRQRVAASYHLTALSEEECRAYIAARLAKAGGDPSLFSKDAMAAVFKASGGIPRSINLFCDAALVYGFADEVPGIDAAIIEQVVSLHQGWSGPEVDPAAALSVSENHTGDSNLTAKIEGIEARMRELQIRLDLLQRQHESRAREPEEKLLSCMNLLLQQEREKSDRLLKENALLQAKLQTLAERTAKAEKAENAAIALEKLPAETRPDEESIVSWFKQAFVCKKSGQ